MPKTVDRPRIVAMGTSGFPEPEIARRLSVSLDTVRKALRDFGGEFVEDTRLRTTSGEHQMWRDAVAGGERQGVLARRVGRSRAAVSKVIRSQPSTRAATAGTGLVRRFTGGGMQVEPGDILRDEDGTEVVVTPEWITSGMATFTKILATTVKTGFILRQIQQDRFYLLFGCSSLDAFLQSKAWPFSRQTGYNALVIAGSLEKIHIALTEAPDSLEPEVIDRYHQILELGVNKQMVLAKAGLTEGLIEDATVLFEDGRQSTIEEVEDMTVADLRARLQAAERARQVAEDSGNRRVSELRDKLGETEEELQTVTKGLERADQELDEALDRINSASPFLTRAKTFDEKKTMLLEMQGFLTEIRKRVTGCEITYDDEHTLHELANRVADDVNLLLFTVNSLFAIPMRDAVPMTPRTPVAPYRDPEVVDDELVDEVMPSNILPLGASQIDEDQD